MISLETFEKKLTKKEKKALEVWSRMYPHIPGVIDGSGKTYRSVTEIAEAILKNLSLDRMRKNSTDMPRIYIYMMDGVPRGTIYRFWDDGHEEFKNYKRPKWDDAVKIMRVLAKKLNGVLIRSESGDRYLLVAEGA